MVSWTGWFLRVCSITLRIYGVLGCSWWGLVAVVGSLWLTLGGGLAVGVSFWFGCGWGWF